MLERARERGLLGPGPVEDQIAHARAFAVGDAPARLLDLGSGAGLPGLALADVWPATHVTLLDAANRSASFLEVAVADLGWTGRVDVVHARAEDAARTQLRGAYDLVVSRGFGRPAVTAECAAGFLCVGGTLVVSDPPSGAADRWPADGLAELGLELVEHRTQPVHLTVLRQASACNDEFPRRTGVPSQRPLFHVKHPGP